MCCFKGSKDRYTLLSEKALKILRQDCRQYKPENLLLEGFKESRYLPTRTADKIFRNACEKAGIKKSYKILQNTIISEVVKWNIKIQMN